MQQFCQGARLQRGARMLVLLDELHDLVGEFVGRLWPSGARQQAGNAVAFERGLGLIVGWPRQTEKRGGIGLVDAILLDVTQHLVLHLHEIERIEEGGLTKPGCTDGFGPRIECSELAQSLTFGLVGHGITSS
ncbi:hypothetical protein NGR_c22460 [Sinorhizobium fredii NGR234]|uniref:Uncharacterized protein n=1 Tax=Sinorhizobium fredii (strain NBRC 101917 / NGR234) TaxID=394 RepID=C3MFE9_SINFN|nr:hypothetical protein NGR_c22460 [Sinorhizobium fredii NGR234]